MINVKNTVYSIREYLNDVCDNTLMPARYGNRMTGQLLANNKKFAALMSSVFHRWYIPALFICEENIIDGNNRTTALKAFKYENKRLPKKFEYQYITYEEKVKEVIKDEKTGKLKETGKYERDEFGRIVTRMVKYNLGGRTYSELPKEVQDIFDRYPLPIVEFELDGYEAEHKADTINMLVRMYNQNIAFNTNQIAFTRIDRFANLIRDEIMMSDLFKAEYVYSMNDVLKGNMEKIICDAVMLIYFYDNWKKNAEAENNFLNENANADMFYHIADLADDLVDCIDDEKVLKKLCPKSDLASWLYVFDEFKKFNMDDMRFKDFVDNWEELKTTIVNGKDFAAVCGDRKSGKDNVKIKTKANYIITVMKYFFDIEDLPVDISEDAKVKVVENIANNEIETKSVASNVTDNESDIVENNVSVLFNSEYIIEKIKNEIPMLNDLMCDDNETNIIANQLVALFKNVELYKLRSVDLSDDSFDFAEMIDTYNEVWKKVPDAEFKFVAEDAAGLIYIGKMIADYVEETNNSKIEAVNCAANHLSKLIENNVDISGSYKQRCEIIIDGLYDELRESIMLAS